MIFDILLKYSLLKRNDIVINKQKQNIENQKQLAIEVIKLEEAKTDFRERNTHNKLVEDLQKSNKLLESEIQNTNELNRSMVEELKSELISRDRLTNEELRNYEKRYSDSRKEIGELNRKLFEKDEELQTLKIKFSKSEVSKSEREHRSDIRFENGLIVSERFDGNNVLYYDSKTNERYTDKEIRLLMDKSQYERL